MSQAIAPKGAMVTQDGVLCSDYWRLMTELLSPMAVMSEGLGFNLCVAPFLNVCVLNYFRGLGMVLRVEVLALGCHMEGHLGEVS